MEGRHAEAVQRYRETLELSRGMGNERRVTMETMNLASAERGLGQLDEAEAHLREATAARSTSEPTTSSRSASWGSPGSPRSAGRAERSGTLIGAIDAWLEGAGQVLDPDDAPDFDRAVARGRAASPEAFGHGREAGRSISIDAAARLALSGSG